MATYKPLWQYSTLVQQLDDPDGLAVAHVDGVDWIQFDTTFVDGSAEGRLQWNSDDGTLEVGMPGGNVNLQIGQEQLVRCRNITGNTINNGDPVRISGASGGKPLISLASANSIATMAVMGFATENIDHNSNGYVNVGGLVRGVDLSTYNDGDQLYLGATGGVTRPAPSWPNFKVYVAKVIDAKVDGTMLIDITINPWLAALSDVDTTNVVEGSIATYNATNNNWVAGDGTDPVPQYSHLKTGWDESAWDNLNLSINTANYTATLTASADTDYWIEGVRHTFSANTSKSATLNNTEGPKYLILDSSDTLVFSDTAWDIHPNYPATRNEVTVAAGYWSVAQADMITRAIEFHGHHFSPKLHEYLHENFGTRWAAGLGVSTPDNLVLNVAEGEIYDEDIEVLIYDGAGPVNPPPPWWQQELTPLDTWTLYRTGSSGNWLSTNTATTPTIIAANIPQVNTWNGTDWNLTDVGVNKYFAYWVFASSDRRHPVYLIPGQADGGTLQEAEDNNTLGDLDLANLPTAEHKCIAKVIMKRNAASPYYSIEQIDDYRFDIDSGSGASSASDHGALSGLSDDDHTQYSLADGTRDFTGNVTMPGLTVNTINSSTGNINLSTMNLIGYSSTWYCDVLDASTINADYVSALITMQTTNINSLTGTVNFDDDHILTTGNITGDAILANEGLTGYATNDYSGNFTSTITNNSQGAMLLASQHSSTVNGGYYTYGMSVFAYDTPASGITNTGTLGAARFYAYLGDTSTGNTNYITAFTVEAGIPTANAASTILQVEGLNLSVTNLSANSAITSGIALRLQSPAGAGTIANRIGIYSSGEDRNYFEGSIAPGNFSDSTRPSAASLPVGSMIFNTDDNAPNFATAGGWRDATGTLT